MPEPAANVAITAAREAGHVLLRYFNRLDRLDVRSKSRNDFVSEADVHAEQIVMQEIARMHPRDAFLAEESGASGDSDHVWIIDPLDGTRNFIHGIPHFAISIALEIRGRIEHGVIYDPLKEELFVASRGRGAVLNDRKIRVSNKQGGLESSLLGTGFPFRAKEHLQAYTQTFEKLLESAADMRRTGSAALDLAYVACGRFDGFWELGLQNWDTAAGGLLVHEAGGMVSDFEGNDQYRTRGDCAAATPSVAPELIRALEPLHSKTTA